MDRTRTIATDRLVLRPLRQTDTPAIQRILSGPRISRDTVSFPHPYPPGAALAWIREELHRQQQGSGHPWAITLQVIGVDDLKLYRIEARCLAENVASGRVLRKAGMSLECYLHGGFRDKDGNPRNGEIYSVTRPVDALPSRRKPS